MNMKSKELLLELNRRGLIPGPEESEAAFFARCRRAAHLPSPPASSLAQHLFDIAPDWVEINYTAKGLRFWEGACTWIEENQITLQLHPAFLKKMTYWRYGREEVIAHELVHVVRGAFEEPVFEEILAYRTSSSPVRRFWGPILRSANESLIGVLSLMACTVAAFFEPLYLAAMTGTVGLLGGGIIRLVRTQRTFTSALHKIAELFGDEKAHAVMIRLTDREIIRFSKMEVEAIAAYAVKMAKIHIRWKQIMAAYFERALSLNPGG